MAIAIEIAQTATQESLKAVFAKNVQKIVKLVPNKLISVLHALSTMRFKIVEFVHL